VNNNSVSKQISKAGWLLAISVLLGTGLLAVIHWHSKSYIAENQRLTLLRSLNAVVPTASYNNDILQDYIEIVSPKYLGTEKPSIVYRARKAGRPVAAVLTVVAPNGYSGPIVLLVGINYAGDITGVRVVKHRETPGLGDAIEIERNPWINIFSGKSIDNPTKTGWQVKRDGGEFDQFTGATITPRAVVAAVYRALAYFEQNRDHLFFTSVAEQAQSDPVKHLTQ